MSAEARRTAWAAAGWPVEVLLTCLGAGNRGLAAYGLYTGSKCLRVYGILSAVRLLSHLPVVVFCFLTLLFASAAVFALQRPWTSARKLSNQQWLRVAINGALLAAVWLVYSKGLQECGALRAIILEHSHVCIAGLLGFIVQSQGGAVRRKRLRGELLFLGGFLLLLFHSVDNGPGPGAELAEGGAGLEGTAGGDGGPGVLDELGLVGGLALLVVSSLLGAVRERFASKVAKDIGGSKRLHALSLVAATAALLPLVLLDFIGEAVVGADYDYRVLSWATIGQAALCAMLVVVLQFYTDSVAASYIRESTGDLISLVVSFLVAFAALHLSRTGDESMMDHERNFVPIFAAWGLAAAGLFDVSRAGAATETPLGNRPYGFGYGDDRGQPGVFGFAWRRLSQLVLADDDLDGLYTRMPPLYPGPVLKDMSWGGIATGVRRMMRHVASSPDSRKIAIFLTINLAFMFVEVLVGFWTNSLGLISDAGHMFFDCAALFIGLFASFVSKWKPDRHYTYGYARYETICGFVNGVFLVFIAVFIMTESLERLSEPPELTTGGLLTTSVFGFLVNLVGLVFFHDHAHAGEDSHGHAHDHGHSHSNDNMHGVFLHVLADALGSLGVIISSLLIEYKGWFIADPLCSLLISLLILMAVYPLLRSTARSLLLIVPDGTTYAFQTALREIAYMDAVVGIREPQLWLQAPGVAVVALHVIVVEGASEQVVSRQVEDVIRVHIGNCRHLTVQVYRRSALAAMLEVRRQHSIPLFWDYQTGALVRSTDGLLSPDQKSAQRDQLARGGAAVFAPGPQQCSGHGHEGKHGHSHAGHGHSHGDSVTVHLAPPAPHAHAHGHGDHQAASCGGEGHGHSHGHSHGHGHGHSEGLAQLGSAAPHGHSHGGAIGHAPRGPVL